MYDQLYHGTRERIGRIMTDLDRARLDRRVPACPEWSVLDVLRHLSGAAADVVTGNLDGLGTPEWTDAQVRARQGRGVGELLTEWEDNAVVIEDALRRGRFRKLVVDALTHEADLRGALELAPPPTDAVGDMLDLLLRGHPLAGETGTLLIDLGQRRYEVGEGDPVTTLEIDPVELFRGLMGRRSAAQLGRWHWNPSAGRYPEVLPAFPLRAADLVEAE